MTQLESDILHSLVHKTSPAYRKIVGIQSRAAKVIKEGKFGDSAMVELREILALTNETLGEFDRMTRTLLKTGG